MKLSGFAVLILACVAVVGCDYPPDVLPAGPSAVASRLQLTVSPQTVLRSGGTATVDVRVTDAGGTNVAGSHVEISTDAGLLSSTRLTTDENGRASATLTVAEPATVRASGAAGQAAVNVSAITPFVVRVSPMSTPITAGTSAGLIVTVTPAPGVAALVPFTAELQCGSAAPVSVETGAGRCTFPSTGPQTVRASAIAENGFTASASTTIDVVAAPAAPRPPSTVFSVTATPLDTPRAFAFNVTNAPAGTVRYRWNFGDERHEDTILPYTGAHQYEISGEATIIVTALDANGAEIGRAQRTIRVN